VGKAIEVKCSTYACGPFPPPPLPSSPPLRLNIDRCIKYIVFDRKLLIIKMTKTESNKELER